NGGEDRLRIDASVQAVVDAAGVYTELPRAEQQPLDYAFVRNADGEWRISQAPEGTVISSRGFERSFIAYPLYFFDSSGTALVPDLRWFPDTASRAERIVRQLLAGPAPWYQNGVLITSFPTGTKLDPGVSIEAGTATVALSNEVAAQDAETRWRMQQQLRLSLAALGEVKAVQMTAGGFPVEVESGRPAESSFLVSNDPLGLAEDGFGYLSASAVDPVPGISEVVQQLGAFGATLARGGESAAVRTAQGVWLVRAGRPPSCSTRGPGSSTRASTRAASCGRPWAPTPTASSRSTRRGRPTSCPPRTSTARSSRSRCRATAPGCSWRRRARRGPPSRSRASSATATGCRRVSASRST